MSTAVSTHNRHSTNAPRYRRSLYILYPRTHWASPASFPGLEVTYEAPCPDPGQLGIAEGQAQAARSDRLRGQSGQGTQALGASVSSSGKWVGWWLLRSWRRDEIKSGKVLAEGLAHGSSIIKLNIYSAFNRSQAPSEHLTRTMVAAIISPTLKIRILRDGQLRNLPKVTCSTYECPFSSL